MKKKIAYIHPAIRIYRLGIFELLHDRLDVSFFWSGKAKRAQHIVDEVAKIQKNTKIKNEQLKEVQFLPFDNFSFSLFKLGMADFGVYIFSSCTSIPFIVLAPILKLRGKKVILFDELWRYPKEVLKYKLMHRFVKFFVKNFVDAVVTAGSKAKEFYISEFNFDPQAIFIAYNTTIDLSKTKKDETKNNLVSGKLNNISNKKRILYLGRILEYKGLDVLIRAMKNVSSEYDLVVVGEGNFKNECQKLTTKLKLDDRVHFLGACSSDETKYYYTNCDLFVLPTKFHLKANVQVESWGFTINEAMSLGVPVVSTTAVGSAFDLIVDGETGAIAQAGDHNDMSDKLNFLIKNIEHKDIGNNAKKHLKEMCNYEDNFIAYEKAINYILD